MFISEAKNSGSILVINKDEQNKIFCSKPGIKERGGGDSCTAATISARRIRREKKIAC